MNPHEMALSAALDLAVRDARSLKEARVRDCHSAVREATDIPPLILGWRGPEAVVLLSPAQVNRDDALNAARLAAVWFSCDIVACSTDSWQSGTDHNPTTGKPWMHGEMQRAAEEDGALEAGWVTQALTTWVINRSGDMRGACLPYRVTQRLSSLGIPSHELTWQPAMPSDAKWSGLVIDRIVEFMNEPTTDEVLTRAGVMPAAREFGLSDEEARAHMDCAFVKTLHRSGFEGSVMLLADTAVRASVIEGSLGRRNAMRQPW